MDKGYHLRVLQNAWAGCRGCGLADERKNVVFGYGNHDAQIMIVGEAPGENEDKYGVPFIGQAGMLLDRLLGSVSVRPEVVDVYKGLETIRGNSKESERQRNDFRISLRNELLKEFFFSNVVMCKPPENRDPLPKEAAACRPRLLEQIYTIDPVLIIAAGRVATEAILEKKTSILAIRGELFDLTFKGKGVDFLYSVMAVLHPSYLLRNNDFNQVGGNAVNTRNDFLKAMRIVDEYNLRHYGMEKPKNRPKPVR